MSKAGVERPDAVAYTAGPGLVGALMVGGGMAAGLGLAWGCPVVPVHHMEGHLLAPMLEDDPPAFPFLALLVSGGHSMLISVRALGEYELLGTTLDDAVGEAFDLIDRDFLIGPWVMGEQYTICDPYLFMASLWRKGDGVPAERHPRVEDHMTRMKERPAVQAVMVHHRR